MNYSFKNEYLIKNDKKYYRFDWPIKSIIYFNEHDVVIVLLDRECYRKNNRNIFCIDGESKLIWQIPDIELVTINSEISPYTKIVKVDNLVKAFNWDGTILKLDPISGEIVDNSWTK